LLAVAGLSNFHNPWGSENAPMDKMIPPDAQRIMSKRAGSTVVEVKGSHSVYVPQPQAVVSIIEKAATGVGAVATK